MKSKLTYLFIFWISLQISAAQSLIYSGSNGTATFFSQAPLEDIEAKNSQVYGSLNTAKNSIEIKMFINQFQFKNKLMQQHFNENFMDSKRYPQSVFKGKIYEKIDFTKPGIYYVSATGEFDLHGTERIRTLHGKLIVTSTTVTIETQFDVLLADHNIEIPEIVFNKVAEKIRVNASLTLFPESLVSK
jgi:polyisoprenoid-binding protein YceI